MSEAFAPSSRAVLPASTAPRIRTAYVVTDPQGSWRWSDVGPSEAGVITDAQGSYQIDTAAESTVRVVLGSTGSPVILGEV